MFTKIKTKLNVLPKDRGFSLVELLVYAAGLVMLVIVIIGLITQFYSLYRKITLTPRADRVGLIVIDRIVKDIRSGTSINLGQSNLGVSGEGSLHLTTAIAGNSVDKFFQLSDGRITYQEGGGTISFLSPSDIEITNLRFDYLLTDISQGVRVEIDIAFDNGDETIIKEYQGFAILRHSYE